MTVFLQFLDSRVAKIITKPLIFSEGDEDTLSDITTKEYNANSKAHYALLQELNDDDIARVINCKSASYDIWHNLIIIHEAQHK